MASTTSPNSKASALVRETWTQRGRSLSDSSVTCGHCGFPVPNRIQKGLPAHGLQTHLTHRKQNISNTARCLWDENRTEWEKKQNPDVMVSVRGPETEHILVQFNLNWKWWSTLWTQIILWPSAPFSRKKKPAKGMTRPPRDMETSDIKHLLPSTPSTQPVFSCSTNQRQINNKLI